MDLIETSSAYRKRQWQDTSAPPNLLLYHLGPGLTAFPLQYDLDVSNNVYHRDSMKGQTTDPTNALVGHPGPPANSILNLDATEQTYHHDSMSGQVTDQPNGLITLTLSVSPGQPGSIVHTPVFTRGLVQDTNQSPNLVINLIQLNAPPFIPIFFDDQARRRESLSGQMARVTNYLPQPEPTVQNELYTFVFRAKTAQEPFIFPNVVLVNVPAVPLPFVQRQTEDYTYKVKAAQEPYVLPNTLAYDLKPIPPFVQSSFPDLQFKTQPAQAPYDFPNTTFYTLPPKAPPPVIVGQAYEHLQWRGAKTQEHYDFPNVLAIFLPLPVVAGFRVTAVQPGVYQGLYRQIGDVFDIALASDYSAYNVDYGPGAGTTQFGWMMQVPQTTPLFTAATAQPVPLFPVSDPVPPVRTVY